MLLDFKHILVMNLLKYFVAGLPLLFACNSGRETVALVTPKPENEAVQLIPNKSDKAKLVVGVTVDQMRFDYLTRFWDDFGRGFLMPFQAIGQVAKPVADIAKAIG